MYARPVSHDSAVYMISNGIRNYIPGNDRISAKNVVASLLEVMLWRDITRGQVAVPVAEPAWEALEEMTNSMTAATMMEWRVSCTVSLRLWKTRKVPREGQEYRACPASNDMPQLRIVHRRQEMAKIATPRANRALIHQYKAGLLAALPAACFHRGRVLLGPALLQRPCHRALACLIL